jgi:hypothetical protein
VCVDLLHSFHLREKSAHFILSLTNFPIGCVLCVPLVHFALQTQGVSSKRRSDTRQEAFRCPSDSRLVGSDSEEAESERCEEDSEV